MGGLAPGREYGFSDMSEPGTGLWSIVIKAVVFEGLLAIAGTLVSGVSGLCE